MPEATMNEDHTFAARKYEVWLPGKVRSVQTVPVPHTVDQLPHNHLWGSVLAGDAPHILRAPISRKLVHVSPPREESDARSRSWRCATLARLRTDEEI